MEQLHGRNPTERSHWQKSEIVPRAPSVAPPLPPCHRWRIMNETPHLGRDAIRAAALRLAPWLRRTPVLRLAGADLGLAHDVVLKLELLQASGSFKSRGA